jgi:hypothetical protein
VEEAKEEKARRLAVKQQGQVTEVDLLTIPTPPAMPPSMPPAMSNTIATPISAPMSHIPSMTF